MYTDSDELEDLKDLIDQTNEVFSSSSQKTISLKSSNDEMANWVGVTAVDKKIDSVEFEKKLVEYEKKEQHTDSPIITLADRNMFDSIEFVESLSLEQTIKELLICSIQLVHNEKKLNDKRSKIEDIVDSIFDTENYNEKVVKKFKKLIQQFFKEEEKIDPSRIYSLNAAFVRIIPRKIAELDEQNLARNLLAKSWEQFQQIFSDWDNETLAADDEVKTFQIELYKKAIKIFLMLTE